MRRLYQSVLTTRLGAFADMAQRLDDRDNRDDGFRLAGCFVAVADDVDAGEGAYTIMDTHHTLNIVGNECQSVLHGMEARLASVSQEVRVSTYPLRRKGEGILLTKLSPVVLLCFRQNEDNLQGRRVLAESLQRTH